MSTFVTHLHHDLSSRILPPRTTTPPSTPGPSLQSIEDLKSYFLELQPPLSIDAAKDCVEVIQQLDSRRAFSPALDGEQEALQRSITEKLVVGLYVQCLETFLNEASDAETELEWWGDIERSRWYTSYYLLQTLPLRLANLSRTILQTVRSRNIPLRFSLLSPASIRQLFPTRNIFHANKLTVALFPHLQHEPYPVSLLALRHPSSKSSRSLLPHVQTTLEMLTYKTSQLAHSLWTTIVLPVELTRNECRYKRMQLQKIRDDRAAVLGRLMGIKETLISTLQSSEASSLDAFSVHLRTQLEFEEYTGSAPPEEAMLYFFTLANQILPNHVAQHNLFIHEHGLSRPSRLTRLWPKLVLLPPLALYASRIAYESRASLAQTARDAVETMKMFWQDWLLGPLKDVVRTVRAGSDVGVIVTKESVKADLESLERMTLSLAQEKLHYTPEQMAALSQQIRMGDLTAVMQIYEDDIRSPLKSAVGGTLLRTLLVQVQKAKVDIDQALSGIDRLLKSQELTFAFVGVAPALAIVYVAAGYLRTLWSGSRGKGRYGGSRKRAGGWLSMRRIERLLIAEESSKDIEPKTTGLLLLSTTHLRRYAERYLPSNSRLHDGFLEDVTYLEDPALGREAKLRILDRMWRSWGEALGWHRAAIENSAV